MFLAEPPRTAYDVHFSVGKVPVRVSPLFWVGAALLGSNGDGLTLIIVVAALFVSVLVHEMGHAVVMRRFGETPRIVLFILGGLAISDGPAQRLGLPETGRTPREQILISLAGPAAGFMLGGATALVVLAMGGGLAFEFPFYIEPTFPKDAVQPSITLLGILRVMLYINFFFNLLNLLPVYPLDGGQVARELFVLKDPWRGIVRSLWLSVITCGVLVGVAAWQRSFFLAVLFGLLGYNCYLALQRFQGSGGGYGKPY